MKTNPGKVGDLVETKLPILGTCKGAKFFFTQAHRNLQAQAQCVCVCVYDLVNELDSQAPAGKGNNLVTGIGHSYMLICRPLWAKGTQLVISTFSGSTRSFFLKYLKLVAAQPKRNISNGYFFSGCRFTRERERGLSYTSVPFIYSI